MNPQPKGWPKTYETKEKAAKGLKMMKTFGTVINSLLRKGKPKLAAEISEVVAQDDSFSKIEEKLKKISKEASNIFEDITKLKKVFARASDVVTAITKKDVLKLDEQYKLLSKIEEEEKELNEARASFDKIKHRMDKNTIKRHLREFDAVEKQLDQDTTAAWELLQSIGENYVPKELMNLGKQIRRWVNSNLPDGATLSFEVFPGYQIKTTICFGYYIRLDDLPTKEGKTVDNIYIFVYAELDLVDKSLGNFRAGVLKSFAAPLKLIKAGEKISNNTALVKRAIHKGLEHMGLSIIENNIEEFSIKRLGDWKKRAKREDNKVSFTFNAKKKDDRVFLTKDNDVKAEVIKELFIKVLRAANIGSRPVGEQLPKDNEIERMQENKLRLLMQELGEKGFIDDSEEVLRKKTLKAVKEARINRKVGSHDKLVYTTLKEGDNIILEFTILV